LSCKLATAHTRMNHPVQDVLDGPEHADVEVGITLRAWNTVQPAKNSTCALRPKSSASKTRRAEQRYCKIQAREGIGVQLQARTRVRRTRAEATAGQVREGPGSTNVWLPVRPVARSDVQYPPSCLTA
jgi:hypothetical protein